MRRALATTALAAGVALGGAPLIAAPAFATQDAVLAQTPEVVDELQDDDALDGDDDGLGDWGLAGLAGLLGLFGYKKYKEHRVASRNAGTTSRGPVGDVDGDDSGSRRI